MSFEQLESVWPVHGSVLVKDDSVYCVAGRSNFLEGGLRFIQLDLTGKLVKETLIDDRDPETPNFARTSGAFIYQPQIKR